MHKEKAAEEVAFFYIKSVVDKSVKCVKNL